jgi:hypothetical protein
VKRAAIAALAVVLFGETAHADAKADAARALQKHAMEEDYLASDFAKAQEKLERALATCESCPPPLRATIMRDLGVVAIGGGGDRARGVDRFAEALRTDPNVALDKDTKNKEIEAAFAEAKKRVGPAPGLVVTPVPEQRVRTPLPIYVEYTGPKVLTKVVARYRGLGMADFQDLPLQKLDGRGWAGLVPCADVQQGTVVYYVQGYDANNDLVLTAGDRTNPFKTTIRTTPVAAPPHLPNAAPPAMCAEECPPAFPGCKKAGPAKELKDVGELCEEASECRTERCSAGRCELPPSEKVRRRLWVGMAATFDYTFIPSTDDACKLRGDATPLNEKNYYCTRDNGTDYPSRIDATENAAILATEGGTARTDRVSGGGAFGNVRLLVSVEYAATENLLLGGRIGLVLNNFPGTEAGVDGKRFNAPLHAEARATWVFGSEALFNPGIAPYVFAGGGVGHVETRVAVQVTEVRTGRPSASQDVDAWHLAGPWFLAVGGGARVTILPRYAIAFGLRGTLAFGDATAPSVGPELGVQMGF